MCQGGWREEWANQVCQCVVSDFPRVKFPATSCKLFCERQRCCSSGLWCMPSTLGRWFSEQEKNWRSGVSSKPWGGKGGRGREQALLNGWMCNSNASTTPLS